MTFEEWDNAFSPVSDVKTLVVIDVLEIQVACAKNASQER